MLVKDETTIVKIAQIVSDLIPIDLVELLHRLCYLLEIKRGF